MFAEVPLDNRTVDQLRPLQLVGCFRPPFETTIKGRSDLKFRPGGSFCNIEPKIRQYG
jgi:hypothetical protein